MQLIDVVRKAQQCEFRFHIGFSPGQETPENRWNPDEKTRKRNARLSAVQPPHRDTTSCTSVERQRRA